MKNILKKLMSDNQPKTEKPKLPGPRVLMGQISKDLNKGEQELLLKLLSDKINPPAPNPYGNNNLRV